MKAAQNTLQSSAPAVLGPLLSEACLYLARINPGAFANRPKLEALAAIRAAIAERPGNSTPAEREAAARKAVTARDLADKLEAAAYFYPELFAEALAAHGLGSRAAVVEMLRAYNRKAWHRARCDALKAETAARRVARRAAASSHEHLEKARDAAAAAARRGARPQAGATAEENARAAAGYARLKAAGAFD